MEHLCKLTGEETGQEIYDLWKVNALVTVSSSICAQLI